MPLIPNLLTRLTPSLISKDEKAHLKQNGILSKHEGRGKRTDSSIDGIHECTLTRANTNTENIARLQFSKGEIDRVPFALFRGIRLHYGCVKSMIDNQSTSNYAVSNKSKHTHMTCYAPTSNEFSQRFKEKNVVAVTIIIPPECVSLKKGWCNTGFHTFLLGEDKELLNIPIEKSWEKDGVYYLQLKDSRDKIAKDDI
ncbi:MAG: hypothetical protein RLZZ210_698 [Pseudomonadota bacterium]|jgi:hypothetical protein